MTALLQDRVTAYVADRPDSDFWQIARAIPCLEKTLREILASPLFEERDGRWRIAGTTGRQQPRRRMPQADRMLAVLQAGGWHTIGELWDAGVGRPNSRATDLRKRGFRVEHRHDRSQSLPSKAHQYRIAGPLGAETNGLSVSAPSGRAPDPLPSDGSLAAHQTDGQLVLTGEAFRKAAAA